jgi:hypothetical protein
MEIAEDRSPNSSKNVPEDNLIIRLLFNGNSVVVPGINSVLTESSPTKGLTAQEQVMSAYLEKGPWYKLRDLMGLLVEIDGEEEGEKNNITVTENMGPGKDERPRSKL